MSHKAQLLSLSYGTTSPRYQGFTVLTCVNTVILRHLKKGKGLWCSVSPNNVPRWMCVNSCYPSHKAEVVTWIIVYGQDHVFLSLSLIQKGYLIIFEFNLIAVYLVRIISEWCWMLHFVQCEFNCRLIHLHGGKPLGFEGNVHLPLSRSVRLGSNCLQIPYLRLKRIFKQLEHHTTMHKCQFVKRSELWMINQTHTEQNIPVLLLRLCLP